MSSRLNRDGLLALYDYNTYANHLVLGVAQELPEDEFTRKASPSRESVRGLLQHMLAVEASYVAMSEGHELWFKQEDVMTLEGIGRYWEQTERRQQALMGSFTDADLERQVQVQLRGRSFQFPMWQLLTQAFVHSTHHRGELSIVLTELGHPLPTLDIIIHFAKQSGQEWPWD